MAGFELKSTQFRREREDSWLELQRLVDRIESGGIKQLSAEQLGRLPALYRNAVSSLSVARAISLDRNLLDYLESLASRGYVCLYGTKRSPLEAIREFLIQTFPRSVRRYAGYLAASAGLLGLGILCGFLLTLHDIERYHSLVSPALAQGRTPDASTEELREVLYYVPDEEQAKAEDIGDRLNLFASFLFTHNAKVGILCFALGFAAGAPVVFLLFQNGLLLGAMAALYHTRGLGGEFWAWILPHGITELGAVALCGAAGLVIGTSLIFPGRQTRLQSAATRGREAAMIVIGAVLLFFIAALIEGFFRQLVHDVTVRWLVATASAIAWAAYFFGSGRNDDARQAP